MSRYLNIYLCTTSLDGGGDGDQWASVHMLLTSPPSLPPSLFPSFALYFQICCYCWNHIKENLNRLCPACRTPYADDPHNFSPVDLDEYVQRGE